MDRHLPETAPNARFKWTSHLLQTDSCKRAHSVGIQASTDGWQASTGASPTYWNDAKGWKQTLAKPCRTASVSGRHQKHTSKYVLIAIAVWPAMSDVWPRRSSSGRLSGNDSWSPFTSLTGMWLLWWHHLQQVRLPSTVRQLSSLRPLALRPTDIHMSGVGVTAGTRIQLESVYGLQ